MRDMLICQNANSMGTGISVHPQCHKNRKTHIAVVKYNEVSSDTFELCEPCAEYLKRSAHRNSYDIKITKMKKGDSE